MNRCGTGHAQQSAQTADGLHDGRLGCRLHHGHAEHGIALSDPERGAGEPVSARYRNTVCHALLDRDRHLAAHGTARVALPRADSARRAAQAPCADRKSARTERGNTQGA